MVGVENNTRGMDMSVEVKRYLKSKSGIKKRKFLETKELSFLKDISFYAIAEHKKGKIKQILVEFEPKSVLKLFSKVKKANQLRSECKILTETVKDLKQKNDTLEATVEQNESVKKLLQREIEKHKDKINPQEKSPDSFLSIMDKRGLPLRGKSIQAGHPYLGKKR